jgi:hypothetical protein
MNKKEYKKMIGQLYQRYFSYHNQKENIIYIYIAFEISLLTFIFSLEQWPSCILVNRLKSNCILFIVAILLFIMFLIALHIFLRIQLRLKRWAAIRFKILEIKLLGQYKSDKDDKSIDINPKRKKIILDLFFPVPNLYVKSDVDEDNFPDDLKKMLLSKKLNKTGSYCFELLLSILSFIIILTIGLYTFLF